MLAIKRAYDPLSPKDGVRFLVDGLWPRGVKKTDLQIEAWLKDAAPSRGLRQWFRHDRRKWPEFKRRYFEELDRRPEAWEPLRKAARRGHVTLVYAAHDQEHNNAAALKEYLEKHATSA
jgi:uncharacterized protein YeaO (DUF488 family)